MILSCKHHTISEMRNVPEEIGIMLKTATNEEKVLFNIYIDLIDAFGIEEIERLLLSTEKNEVVKSAVYKVIKMCYQKEWLKMSLGNLLFFISVILLFISIFLTIFIFIFSCLEKEKITNILLKILFVFLGIGGIFMTISLIILYFELGGIKWITD